MKSVEYDALTIDERYKLLMSDEIFNKANDGTAWIPMPCEIAHCNYANLPKSYQRAIETLYKRGT